MPPVVVAIVRFEFVEDARKVYKRSADVVAVMPLMIVVTIPEEAEIEDPVTRDDVAVIPLTDEVSVLRVEVSVALSTKFAVVVATLPLTTEVSMNELVDVEMVSV